MLCKVFLLALAVWPLFGQLPPSEILSDADRAAFHAVIARLEKSRISAPDQCAVTYELARTYAAGKQWPETIEWLRKVAGSNAGLDPSRDSIFAQIIGTSEFTKIANAVRQATGPVSHSSRAFEVTEGDLVPESVAYDPKSKHFYFGSMRKGKVIRCSANGHCEKFADGLGVVVGLKVHGGGLWLLNNSREESALIHYDLTSGRLVRKYAVTGPGHNFNDLAIALSGEIYLTDTLAGAVWRLANRAAKDELVRLPGRFEDANGITLSSDSKFLYVATYPDGIYLVNLKTKAASPMPHPADLCLATIDGLYFYRGALIAIQNAFMSPRVVRLILTRDLRAIERFEILERRNPLFDGITTGVIAGGHLYYMANIQDEKTTGFRPITILKLRL